MSLIKSIRNKPQGTKIRIMLVVIVFTVLLLIGVWIMTSKIGKTDAKDTTLFRTLGRGLKDIKDNWK
jgi:predicted permease